jgi:hypothetical protein
MRTISTHKTVEIAWEISGFDGYAFGADKALYNTSTGRKLRHTINGGRQGWWIGRRFMAHNTLLPLMRGPERIICPF